MLSRRDALVCSGSSLVLSSLGSCAVTPANAGRANALGVDPKVVVGLEPAIRPIRQENMNLCWATVWAMMLSWRKSERIPVAHAVSILGDSWRRFYDRNEGLPPQDSV